MGPEDVNPEAFTSSPHRECICGPIYSYGGHEEPGQYAPDCPVHGEEPPPARRLAVAGVIQKGTRPGTRSAVVIADWGHPKGPAVAKGTWDQEALGGDVRGEVLDRTFRNLARTLGVDQ